MKKLLTLAVVAFSLCQLCGASFKEVNFLISAKNWQEAEKCCRQLISEVKNPNEKYHAYYKLMMIMRRQKKNAELVQDADAFLASCTDANQKANILIYKGLGLRDSKQQSKALDVFAQAVDAAKNEKIARESAYYYISVAGALKKKAEAHAMYERAGKIPGAEKDVTLMLAASFAFWDNGMYSEALAVLDKVDKLENLTALQKSESFRYRGNILHNTKKYEEAIEVFSRALQHAKGAYYIGRIEWSLARSWEAAGNREKALEFYKKAAAYNGSAVFKSLSSTSVKRLSR